VPAVAQTETQTETYETPKYMPAQPSVLDPNYGLPTFGMPGAELPQQRSRALEPEAAEKPDIFKPQTDFGLPELKDPTDFAFPKARGSTTGDPVTAPVSTETPLYTTTEGGTTGSDTMADDDTK
jgi:hypothetical protein